MHNLYNYNFTRNLWSYQKHNMIMNVFISLCTCVFQFSLFFVSTDLNEYSFSGQSSFTAHHIFYCLSKSETESETCISFTPTQGMKDIIIMQRELLWHNLMVIKQICIHFWGRVESPVQKDLSHFYFLSKRKSITPWL